MAPTHLPTIATAISPSVISQSTGRFSDPTSVRRPVMMKKSGSSTMTTKSSSRLETSSVRPAWRGMIRPITNAPKIAAIPICLSEVCGEQDGDEDRTEPEWGHAPDLVIGGRDALQQRADDDEHSGRESGREPDDDEHVGA